MDKSRINYLVEHPTEEAKDIEIINIYRQRCVVCRQPTTQIHEITPKSLTITWKKWINRITLCQKCHNKAHEHGTINSRDYLIACRNQRLGEYWNIWLTM